MLSSLTEGQYIPNTAEAHVEANKKYMGSKIKKNTMVEPLLSGIVLGLIPVTLSGLFVTAYLQYRRGDQLNF
jgi:cytochrome b6-f complex subunit 5